MLLIAALLFAQSATPSAAPPKPLPTPPSHVAQWSATTHEAAATPANQAWLKQGHSVTLTGEVLDLSCYLQMGKRGESHRACGALCVANGEPAGLLTKEGKVYMLVAEQHHPRRDGQVTLAKEMSAKMGDTITVSGMLMTHGTIPTLFIEAPAK